MPVRNRWTVYAGLSTALAGGVVIKALAQRPNFYSAAVYLAQSSANVMILANLVFVVACTILLGLQKLLYGPLRPTEIEQLYEKAWFAVTETCLAMTIFRGEIGAWFLIMFFSLLAGKVWGWIGEGRVEVLEQQPPRNPRLFHTRLALSLGLSVLFDLTMFEYVVKQVMHMARPDMMVMFGFEFAVLSIASLNTAMRYAINLVEIGIVRGQKSKRIEEIRKERIDAAVRSVQEAQQAPRTEGENTTTDDVGTQTTSGADMARETTRAAEAAALQPIDEAEIEVEGWEGKGRWMFYLDLFTDFWKLVLYLSFFFILLFFYGLPLHIMRDVFLTCRSFFKRIGDFMRYRTATRDMNERYPDATAEEIGREDVCIICREEMRPYQPVVAGAQPNPVAERMRPKKLPCGHVLHFSCLRSWLERQQICPTCRATVVPPSQSRQGTTAAGVQGAAAAPGQHQNAPVRQRGGPRVYQFGPLRIGVGAARGNNMFEELEHRLANADNQQNQPANANAPQQYGFGIRWDGVRRRGQPRNTRGTVQEQLESAERQIQRELDSLQTSMGELQSLRNVQAQMARIRATREAAANPQPGAQQPLTAFARIAQPTMTPLIANSQQNVLQAGSDQLPQGLSLPEGWTMMPLQPLQNLNHAQLQPGVPAQPHQTQLNGNLGVPLSQQTAQEGHQHNDLIVPSQTNPETSSNQPLPNENSVRTAASTNNLPPTPTAPSSNSVVAGQVHEELVRAVRERRPPENFDFGHSEARVTQPIMHAERRPQSASPQVHPLLQTQTQEVESINGTHLNETNAGLDGTEQDRTESDQREQTTPISLPSWGFPRVEPTAPEPTRSTVNGEQTRSGQGSNSSLQQEQLQQSVNGGQEGSKKRTATVEDLVEDPD